VANLLHDTALIISAKATEYNVSKLIGTGGWLPPRDREVPDWVTLIKWMGWQSPILHPKDFNTRILDTNRVKWIILADDPGLFEITFIEKLFALLENYPVLVISGAAKNGSAFADLSGVALQSTSFVTDKFEWKGFPANKTRNCRKQLNMHGLQCGAGINPLVIAGENNVLVAVNKKTAGKWVVLSFHPGEARDWDGNFTSLIKDILVYQNDLPVAWFDFEHTVVLRMDDPGSAETVHHSAYQNSKLTEEDWKVIGELLQKRDGRMTLGYVPGWADDGDETRGELFINGEKAKRVAGKIYPSPSVKYQSTKPGREKKLVDYASEFSGIQHLRKKGLVETELHGYTHIHPDKDAWINAADKYENKSWYREFGKNTLEYIKKIPAEDHPFIKGLSGFREIFHNDPCTLICPGDEFTNDVLLKAWEAGFQFISSYYQGIRINNQLCWDQHVCAPYLDKYESSWFDAGLPVVGYFHDFDINRHGINWFDKCIEGWIVSGAKYFMDFRELSSILLNSISITENGDSYQLHLSSQKESPFIKPVRTGVSIPSKNFTSKPVLSVNEETHLITISESQL
jgi:hypothetical protein